MLLDKTLLATIILATLSYKTSYVHATQDKLHGDPGIYAAGRLYVDDNLKSLKLSNLKWIGDDGTASFAVAHWDKQPAFLRCDTFMGREDNIFDILMKYKTSLQPSNPIGVRRTQQPLFKFVSPEYYNKQVVKKANCFVYTFAAGKTLNSHLKWKPVQGKKEERSPEEYVGTVYLHYAGVVHNDLRNPENTMVHQASATSEPTVTIVDYGNAVPLDEEEKAKLHKAKPRRNEQLEEDEILRCQVDNMDLAHLIQDHIMAYTPSKAVVEKRKAFKYQNLLSKTKMLKKPSPFPDTNSIEEVLYHNYEVARSAQKILATKGSHCMSTINALELLQNSLIFYPGI
ncbi:hypothetical protein BDF22DRAFT_698413 [Syncephalis plumigaleata]|nr:hypothetical protein BDF22DRAFT_698413 [Syncephalis plumigaleata]